MAKKFLFEDEAKPAEPKTTLTYGDGFRLGCGLFIAWLLGLLAVSGVATLISRLLHR